MTFNPSAIGKCPDYDEQKGFCEERHRYDNLEIAQEMDFAKVAGLSTEVTQKSSRIKTTTIGQAARIPGITPAAVSILLVAMLKN